MSHRPACLTVAMTPSTQWISSETVLPSEITKHRLTVTMTQAHSEYSVKRCHHQKPFRNHLYTSCKLHIHHKCLLKLCCREESLFTTSLVHTVLHTHTLSVHWNGVAIHGHRSQPFFVNRPFSYTVNGFRNGMALPVTLITPLNGFRNGMALPVTLITPPTIHQ